MATLVAPTSPRIVTLRRSAQTSNVDSAPRPMTGPARAIAVDALRGLAILGMVLVAVEPLHVLPVWMYHAQEPPPDHQMDLTRAGLTWPDLVFPIFIFTLGVAIPLAWARRLERGAGYGEMARNVLGRGVLLLFFALFRQHFDSSLGNVEPEALAWAIGLLGFGVLFAIFTRLPGAWSRPRRLAVRAVGWTAAVLMFAWVEFPDGSRFDPARIDVILLILTYCAVFGTLVWLITRRNVLARLAVVALLVASRLAGSVPGWMNSVYAYDPVPWLYRVSILQFLCIAIPGTIVGDIMVDWMRTSAIDDRGVEDRSWARSRMVALAGVLLLCVPLVIVGVQARYLLATTALSAVLCAAAFSLSTRPATPIESVIAQLIRWGAFWLMLGLILDPLEGGTKKVPETFAWFFQGAGIATFVLLIFTIFTDVLHRPLKLLVANGQNPMLAYVANGMLILPILGLTGAKTAIDSLELSPTIAFLWSLALTLIVAFTVRFFVSRKLLWRS